MIKKLIYNPITSNFDFISNIPQLDADPASPNAEDAWVLRSGGAVSGGGVIKGWIGLGSTPILSPGSGGASTYALKYRTQEGTTVGVALS